MEHPLARVVAAHKGGRSVGSYSVCSANAYAIEAALLQARQTDETVLIEATSNQVDQFGGYTGMTPEQFVAFVQKIAASVDFPYDRLVLGGDHLGPNSWQAEKADEALAKAHELIDAYVSAGFTKIHLDASMRLGDDPGDRHTPLDPAVIADRAAALCRVAEDAFAKRPAGSLPPIYVVGTDVPIPGGAQEEMDQLRITPVGEAEQTIALNRETFLKQDLADAWERVVGVVVQPGVEFGDASVVTYDRGKAGELSRAIEKYDRLVYEAHSTDYQTRETLRQMVKDHFAILKVGPWLTFALREAVFALADMEAEWLSGRKEITLSQVGDVLERVMLAHPEHWQKHYHGDGDQLRYARKYSYSDRVRYYWPQGDASAALARLVDNLTRYPVPITLLSQYMPAQYQAVRAGELANAPVDLIRHKIMEVTGIYAYAAGSGGGGSRGEQ